MYAIVVELAKAFDSVDRKELMQVLATFVLYVEMLSELMYWHKIVR